MRKTVQELRKIADALEWMALATGVVLVVVVYGKPAADSPLLIATMWAFVLSGVFAWSMSWPSMLVIIMPLYRVVYAKIGMRLILLNKGSLLRLVLIFVLFAVVVFLSVPIRTL